MVTYPSLYSPCVTYGTLCHAIDHQLLPTLPLPREAGDFSMGDRFFNHVPLLTYLIYFMAAQICEEPAPREIRTLFTTGLACYKPNALSV